MLWFTRFIGSGIYRLPNGASDGFRPRGIDGIKPWAMIDLRTNYTQITDDDRCLVWTPDNKPIGDGAIPIMYDKSEVLGRGASIDLENRLGVNLINVTDGESLMKWLLFGRQTTRWNSVCPEVNTGWKRVYIAGTEWASEHVEVSKQFGIDPSDNFNRANEATLAAPWAKLAGSENNIRLNNNTISSDAIGDKVYYYDGSTATTDQFSEIEQITAVDVGDYGPAARIGDGGTFTFYWFSNNTGGENFGRFNSGAYTPFGGADITNIANGDVSRITCIGSNHTAYRNGSIVFGPTSEVSIDGATSLGSGIFIYEDNGSLDNWRGGDGDGNDNGPSRINNNFLLGLV